MARGMPRLCAAVFGLSAAQLGCGSGEDPGAAFIARYCDVYKPCCVAAGLPGDGTACRALFAGAASPAAYNATAGESCLAGLQAVADQPGFCAGDVVAPSPCAQAFGGPVGACIQDNDCPVPPAGEDVRCVSAFANGAELRKCQVQSRGQAGSTPCVGSVRGGVALYGGTSGGDIPDLGYLCHADDGLRCDGDSGACVALTATGAPCELSSHCAESEFCDATSGLCAARKPIDAACIDQALECGAGLYCEATALVCVTQRHLGDACTDNGQCLSGNCPDGVCESTPPGATAAVCGG